MTRKITLKHHTNTYLDCPNKAKHIKRDNETTHMFTTLIKDERPQIYCTICGTKLILIRSKSTYESTTCDKCGTHVFANELYCVNCGEIL